MPVDKDEKEVIDMEPAFPTSAELLDAGYVRANFEGSPDTSEMRTAIGHPFPTHDEIIGAGYVPLSRRQGRLKSRPRVSQMYWVDFHHDAYSPEFEGEHPGIVIRAAQKLLHDTCIVLPVTSAEQKAGTHFHTLSWNPNTDGRKKNITAYVVCDHFYTVNNNRLRPLIWNRRPYFPRAYPEDMKAIFNILEKVLSISVTAILEQDREVSSNTPVLQPTTQSFTGKRSKKLTLPE